MDSRRRTYILLIGIILLTLPCYCAGIVAYSLAPDSTVPVILPPSPTNTPTRSEEATETFVPLPPTPVATIPSLVTPGSATATLPATPGQFVTSTPSSVNTLVATPTAVATETPTETATSTPTITATPTETTTPTATLPPLATLTFTPTPPTTATAEATPTITPEATRTPEATATLPVIIITLTPTSEATETP